MLFRSKSVKRVDIDGLVKVLLELRTRMKYVDIQIDDDNTMLLQKSENQTGADTNDDIFNNSGLAG